MHAASLVALDTLDVAVFVVAIGISVLIGVFFANKNATLNDYMLGGREQRLLPVSLSMMTSFISGLTLIGASAELYYHGATYALVCIGVMLSVPISAFLLMPVFYRLECVSIFAYFEKRYNVWIKRLISLVFMLQMTLYNAVVLYVPSLSLKSLLGVSDIISIGAVGGACLVYGTLGGIKAVIWTDFFQALLMYATLLVICVAGTMNLDVASNDNEAAANASTLSHEGFMDEFATKLGELVRINAQGERLSVVDTALEFNLQTRHTFYTVALGGTLVNVFMNGANQIQVQRALSLPSLRLAQIAMLLTGVFSVFIILIASFMGLILYATYHTCDPFDDPTSALHKRDGILIYYVATQLEHLPGVRGLFVAGIFAATLSTLSSFQNSMAALMLGDFIQPLYKAYRLRGDISATANATNRRSTGCGGGGAKGSPRTSSTSSGSSDNDFGVILQCHYEQQPQQRANAQRGELGERTAALLGKLISLAFGLACIALTFFAGAISGLLQVALTLFGALGAPVLSGFVMGMCTRCVNSTGMTIGMLVGFSFGLYIQFYQTLYLPPLEPSLSVSTDGCAYNELLVGAALNDELLGGNQQHVDIHLSAKGGANWLMNTTLQQQQQQQHHSRTFLEQFCSMSYFWLPVISFMITSAVACLTSLLTGGCSQQVDDNLLIACLWRRQFRPIRGSAKART